MGVVKVEDVQSDVEDADIGEEFETIDLIKKSGMFLGNWLFIINAFCFTVVTIRFYISNKSGFYKHPVSTLLKMNIQKLSLMNFLSGLSSFTLAYWLSYSVAVEEDVENTCFTLGRGKYMILLILMFSIGVCYIRYIAFGLASSDSQDLPGGDIGRTTKSDQRVNNKPDILIGFQSQRSPIFLSPLKVFALFAFASFLLSIYLFFGPIPSAIQTFLFHWSFCVSNEVVSRFYRLIIAFSCTLLYNINIILSEKLLRQPMASDVRGILYLTPFTVSTAGTSSACWMFLLAFMVFWLSFCSMKIILVWSLCSSLDAIWSLVLGFSIPMHTGSGSKV